MLQPFHIPTTGDPGKPYDPGGVKHEIQLSVLGTGLTLIRRESLASARREEVQSLVVTAAQRLGLRLMQLKGVCHECVHQPWPTSKEAGQSLIGMAAVDKHVDVTVRAQLGQKIRKGLWLVERLPPGNRDAISMCQPWPYA